jgi:hypothetical protein
VRDAAALIQQEGRVGLARGPAVHRARLDHQIVVGPVERVGQQRLDPGPDRVALDVARDDPELTRNRVAVGGEPLQQRAVGDLRREARQHAGIGPNPGDLVEKRDQPTHHRNAGQVHAPLEDRQIGIEPLRGEQGAAGGTGDTHDPLDHDPVAADQIAQGGQLLALHSGGRGAGGGPGAGAGQRLRHQSAA